MKKKFLLTASTAILALGVLTACGDKKEETDKQDPAQTEQQQDQGNNETTPEAEDNGDAEGDNAEDNGDAEGDNAEGDNEDALTDGEEEEEAN